ncbi:MAG: hypothetical protein JWO06_3571 [Bacteroidota bacterium]|nr:hypothetical protein [Bacteroidota bacterium]
MTVTIPAFQSKLAKSHWTVTAVFAALVTFGLYSCMYAFRKPFTAATFDGITYVDVKFKILLVIAQLIGYTLSKFMGIKIVSEMKKHHRALSITGLIIFAWLTLLLFPLVPLPLKIVCLFLNGIPLGLVWGLVFSYIEGRRATEFMGSVLAVSFIFSSGFVKSVGKWLMDDHGVSQFWMPFATGAIFIIPMLLFVFLLEQIPPPSKEDIALRTERLPMTQKERKDFVSHFLPGIIILVLTYVMLSVIRDFRDNFVADIWKELGNKDASIFTQTEIPISIAVLVFMSLLIVIRNNFRALQINHLMVIAGFIIAGVSTYFYAHGNIEPKTWIILNGLGLYLGYIPFNIMFFERLIAAARKPANVGFLIYIADSFGYLGSIGVLLFKNFGNAKMSYSDFFTNALYIVSVLGVVLTLFSLLYFSRKIVGSDRAA